MLMLIKESALELELKGRWRHFLELPLDKKVCQIFKAAL
jgi:hypothetical protein